MDLEDTSTSVLVEILFAAVDPKQLAQAYLKDRDDDQSLIDYLASTLHDHFKLDQYKLSPDGSQSERLPDRGILQRLIRIDVVSAQRHIDDREEGSKVSRRRTGSAHASPDAGRLRPESQRVPHARRGRD